MTRLSLSRLYLRHVKLGLVLLALGTALLVFGIPWAFHYDRARAAGVWTESWASTASVTANWRNIGAQCWTVAGRKITFTCQSAGIVTRQTWSRAFRVEVETTVKASAAPGSSKDWYFAGLTLYNDDNTDTNYGELALVHGFVVYAARHVAESLVDEYGIPHADITPYVTHALKVVYLPAGLYEFWLDGVKVGERPGILNRDPAIFILCVSVPENTPNDGSAARCEFGPLTVRGVPSANVTTNFLPLVGDRPVVGYP